MERATKDARCLFCSLGCPCQVEFGQEVWTTSAPQQGQGLCARAFYIGNLMSHPERINLAARRQNGRFITQSVDDALDAIARRIRSNGPTAMIIDGTYPTEAISAALAFAAEAPDTLGAVYLPAGDEAILAGIAAAGWSSGSPPSEANDVVLVVGDAFATHPPIARRVLESKYAGRRNQLLVVSPFVGRTAAFATLPALVAPGGEEQLLLDVAQRLGALPAGWKGIEEVAGADAIAAALSGAKTPAIELAQPEGTTANGHRAALAAAHIASKLKAPFLPLFTYGNALGAHHAADQNAAMPMADLAARALSGEINNVVLIGIDLPSALPDVGSQMLDAVEFVASAAPFAGTSCPRANVVVPVGLCCEEPGTATLSSGEAIQLDPPAPPIAGALQVSSLIEELRKRVSAEPGQPQQAAGPPDAAWRLGAPGGKGMMLVASGDVMGFADGSLSRYAWWAQAARPQPSIAIHPDDGKHIGVFAGSKATVKTAAGQAVLNVETSQDVPPGVASVPMCLGPTRRLFRWELVADRSAVRCGPTEVKLSAAD